MCVVHGTSWGNSSQGMYASKQEKCECISSRSKYSCHKFWYCIMFEGNGGLYFTCSWPWMDHTFVLLGMPGECTRRNLSRFVCCITWLWIVHCTGSGCRHLKHSPDWSLPQWAVCMVCQTRTVPETQWWVKYQMLLFVSFFVCFFL